MYNQFEQMIAALGQDRVMDIVNKYQANMDYRKDYGKKRRVETQAIVQAFKSGQLSFGGTRVDMGGGQEEEA